jgi:predicted GNAT family acetyltransferase
MPDPAPRGRDHAAAGEVAVADVPAAHRYRATLDGRAAGHLEYRRRRQGEQQQILALHTVVGEEFEGRGVGSALARALLDQARAGGVEVVAYCPFVREYVGRHPEYADGVTGVRRRRDLPAPRLITTPAVPGPALESRPGEEACQRW